MRTTLAASFAAMTLLLGAGASERVPPSRSSLRLAQAQVAQSAPAAAAAPIAQTCPAGTIPDGDVCVHIPTGDDDGALAPSSPNLHRERSGRWAQYEQIPRRPERTADYDAYRYPVPPGLPGGHSVISGYDLDRPDEQQRRARTLRAVGHGGVDLPQAKGTPVKLVALEHQKSEAEVVYTGPLFGTSVVTLHTLREGGRFRDYVVIFGHLDGVAPGVGAGTVLRDGDVLGFVGDTGSSELVHLHYETRRVRDGVDLKKVIATGGAGRIVADDVSVVCDPRNVLPLK
jgi:murein DD-endopeptidase MepM/ murein hydrolase activator NlpD